jgi:predicted dehydrogenase
MAESSSEVRWLLVGTGDIAAKRVAPAMNSMANSRLVGVCSRSADRAKTFAQQVGTAESYGDLAEALRNTTANAVYVATSVDLHAAQAIAAAKAGKHVLVEKPLALNALEGFHIAMAAEKAGVIGGCAYYRRFSPRYEHAQKMIAAGEFGQILFARMIYHTDYNPAPTDPKYWRVVRAKSAGGAIADIGSHMFDVLIGLLGSPKSVDAKLANRVHQYDVEDTASVMMEMAGGAQASGHFSWCSKTWAHEFEIIGSEARLRWAPFDTGKVIKTVGRDVHELDLTPASNVHEPLIADFVDAVIHNRPPRVSLREAAKTTQLLDAMHRSSAERREVSF